MTVQFRRPTLLQFYAYGIGSFAVGVLARHYVVGMSEDLPIVWACALANFLIVLGVDIRRALRRRKVPEAAKPFTQHNKWGENGGGQE